MTQDITSDIRIDDCAQNRAVVLDEDALFYGTGYKMLRSQGLDCLAPCVRARLNGHVQLVYVTRNYVPLLQFAQGASGEAVARALGGFVDAVLELRANGFLSDRSVLLDADTVYVDPATESVKLLYVPLTRPVAGGNDVEVGRRVFDTCQAALAAVSPGITLSGSAAYEWGKLEMLRSDLGKLTSASAWRHAARHTRGGSKNTATAVSEHADVAYLLSAQVGGRSVSVRVCGPRTVLGKSASRADCVVNASPAISRAHCALSVRADGSLAVTDLGSRNGTWADGVRVQPNTERVIADGGTLKLANIMFTVTKVGQ